MKRIGCLIVLCALIVSVSIGASVNATVPGDAADPVISLSYLTEVYKPLLLNRLNYQATQALNAVYSQSLLSLTEAIGAYNQQRDEANTQLRRTDGELILKYGDILTLEPGTKLLLTSGTAYSDSDHLINVSAATRLSEYQPLTARMFYMKDDNTDGGIFITSETAAVIINGPYSLQSSDAVNIASRADVLKELGLFLGYASGYELQKNATRLQGLVVFLRIMGLEDEALAYTGTHPFTDIAEDNWGYPYVAYAYDMGFTKGYSETQFKPNLQITAKQYIAFMMRALNYEEDVDFVYSTLLTDCVSLGLYHQAEIDTYTTGTFTRGRMVYLSYYSLFCTDQQSGQILLDDLIADGTFTQETADKALCKVVGTRLS